VSRLLIYALAVAAAIAIVFWIGLAYWVNKDARRRIRNPFLVLLATAVGLVPCVGPLVYLLFRPSETRDDVRSRNAELAALEAQIVRHHPTCPECSAVVEANYLVCPVCATRLREPCAQCDAPLDRLWQICPYCATPIEEAVDLDVALTRELRPAPALDLVAESTRSSVDA
jgi:hypothetical protein